MPEPWPVEIEIPVQWRDVDGAGHVNNAVYFSYLESARAAAFLQHFGWREAKQYRIIVARAEIDFLSPAVMHETLVVRVSPARVGKTSFVFRYEVEEKATKRPVAHGSTVQVWFDYGLATKQPLPADARKVLEAGAPTG